MPFLDAALMGQALDGGLLVPASLPDLSAELENWRNLSYQELACAFMAHFINDIPADDLSRLVYKSYAGFEHPNIAPVVGIGNYQILELFHGPSLAFKDFGLQFLGNAFDYGLDVKNRDHLNVICATSGDTGGAAIAALRGKARANIIVLHPAGRPSRLQRLQMTTALDSNVHNLAIEGTFDDCQAIMKSILGNLEFRQAHALSTVNSVNWARLLAQVVYYFYAYFRTTTSADQRVVFSVPTGNFGNCVAGYFAARLGLPVAKLILSTNSNDILSVFFRTGAYRLGEVLHTLSPAMDIQTASNMERYLYLRCAGDTNAVRNFFTQFNQSGQAQAEGATKPVDPLFEAQAIGQEETLATMKKMWSGHAYLLDPHTAVGVAAAMRTDLHKDYPVICVATAHPAKFPETIRKATGEDNAKGTGRHSGLDALEGLPERYRTLAADKAAVMAYIEQHCQVIPASAR